MYCHISTKRLTVQDHSYRVLASFLDGLSKRRTHTTLSWRNGNAGHAHAWYTGRGTFEFFGGAIVAKKSYWGRTSVVARSREANVALATVEKSPPSEAALALLEKARLRKETGSTNITKVRQKAK